MAAELIRSVAVGNELGEGVLWNEQRQTVWWTDIEGSKLFEFDPDTDALQTRDTPHRVACFGFVEGTDSLIVAFDQGIALYDPQSAEIDWLVGPDVLSDGLRFNDGKIDPEGRFWVGTLVEDPARATETAALYCLDPDGGLVTHIDDIAISNGLCWSPDGTVMYHADSPTNSICAYDFDAGRGTLSGHRTFATTAKDVHPDGSTVDADGGMWNAQWGGGQVVCYSPDGRISHVIELPVSQPTCVAFGGENLDLLFVTSARAGLSDEDLVKEPAAGDLFVFRTDCTGLAAPRLASL